MSIKSFIVALAAFVILPATAIAQDAERVWENGSVWTVSQIETKPGHFNDYIKDLSNVWRKYLDAQKRDGFVLSYKMLNVNFARDGEPDLILLVEYKNWAAFDQGVEYFEKLAQELQGSIKSAQVANINREELRSLRGGLVAQEVKFKN